MIVENKRTDGVSLDKKKKTWKEITDEYNCRPDVRFRTEAQLRKCWDNLKEKWRKGKADDMKEVFTTGGGCAPASQLTDELERVGAVASHMSTRVENPFDSDRGRHAATPRSQSTPSVVSLLQPMQVETLEPPNDGIYEWEIPASPGESSQAVCMQDAQNGATAAEVELSAEGGPAALQPAVLQLASPLQAAPLQTTPQHPAPAQRRMHTKKEAVEEELSARLSGVEEDNKRKRKEHLLKMKLMRTQHALHMKHAIEMHELDCASKKAKLELLTLKIAAVRKASK
ncbi:hypothetical protein HPB49_023639 [Dermacentor silvarum]|uniref:Uncharacterized protein n=1 Tax=Dermacentor silvarum TaxID=543639 RepID=A0ACB8CNE2_DERSI|nr:hypothetical protein HPB49_023639 [Dermacentor silvarum]